MLLTLLGSFSSDRTFLTRRGALGVIRWVDVDGWPMVEWQAMFYEDTPMSQAEKAELYRNQQAGRLLQLFQAANGRKPTDTEELNSWAASPKGLALIAGQLKIDESGQIDPYK